MNQKRSKKGVILAVVILCILALVFFGIWWVNRPAAVEGEKFIKVEVTHGNGSNREFSYHTDLEYLGELLEQEGLISGTNSTYGLFVDTVDGETANYDRDGSWWRLTCNGVDAETGADSVVLQDGDVYGWIYTIG